MKIKLFLIIFSIALVLAGCSNSDDVSSGTPINGPQSVEITAKHEEFTVQFSKIAGIGVGDNLILPRFEFYINTQDSVSDAEHIGNVQQENDGSGLMRQFIKPQKTELDGNNIVLEYPIEDKVRYYVWVRACFEGYGCSDWTGTSATPIPYPAKLTKDDVEVIAGDKTILVKIKNPNGFDEYGVLADDDCNSEKLPRFDPRYETSNDNLVISKLTNGTSYPVCIRAQNVNTDRSNPDTISWLLLGDVMPLASTKTPAKPEIVSTESGHKRIMVKWTGDYEGDDAVSSYEVVYTDDKGEEKSEPVVTDTYDIEHTIVGLENNVPYNIKVRAVDSDGNTDSEIKQDTPEEKPVDFNNLDTVLGKTSDIFIYAEDVPHSDFWRIAANSTRGGRASSDRLVRGKETALGNLWSDAVQYYVKEKLNRDVDFTVLAGEMITNGMETGASITPRLLQALTNTDYIEDTIVIVDIKGKYLISEKDYGLDLANYPTLGRDGYGMTLFGQAAAVFRNGHYGTGVAPLAYGTKIWLMPSKEVRYIIEYLPYDLEAFKTNFANKCSHVDSRTGISSKTNSLYDSYNDPDGCYLLGSVNKEAYQENSGGFYYAEAQPEFAGYIRGKIKKGSLLINGSEVDPDKTYKVATTKHIADLYIAFTEKENTVNDTGVVFWKAVADYVNEQGSVAPILDGRVKLDGGVPGNADSDFKE